MFFDLSIELYFIFWLFFIRIQRFLNELEKSLNTTARKEPLNTTNYLACQRILTEFVKIFDTQGYEKVCIV